MRKINEKLMERLTKGDLEPLLNHIRSDTELCLEVRRKGKAYVYYKKCKVLDLGLYSYNIENKYFENKQKPDDIKDMVINNPQQYFKDTLLIVDKWLGEHPKDEFETQQNIAYENKKKNDRYIILDMEYNFSQSEIKKSNRVKPAGFDLLGIERQTGKIVFFEVKKGLKALKGKAGIKTHIEDFEECLYGKNKVVFRKNLIIDIDNIVSDKKKLGLIDNFDIPSNFSSDAAKLIFVIDIEACKKDDYFKKYNEEYKKSTSQKKYDTIFVSENNYKLK